MSQRKTSATNHWAICSIIFVSSIHSKRWTSWSDCPSPLYTFPSRGTIPPGLWSTSPATAGTSTKCSKKGSGCDGLIRFVFTVKWSVFLIDDCFHSSCRPCPQLGVTDAEQSGLETRFCDRFERDVVSLGNFFPLELNPMTDDYSLSLHTRKKCKDSLSPGRCLTTNAVLEELCSLIVTSLPQNTRQ